MSLIEIEITESPAGEPEYQCGQCGTCFESAEPQEVCPDCMLAPGP